MCKSINFRKVTILVFTVLCLIIVSVPVYAAETVEINELDTVNVEPRLNEDDKFLLNSNTSTALFTLSKNVTAGVTTKKYQIIKTGNDCTVVVKLTNEATKKSYTMTLEADGEVHSKETIGVSIPSGTYTVSFASAPCNILRCECWFFQ